VTYEPGENGKKEQSVKKLAYMFTVDWLSDLCYGLPHFYWSMQLSGKGKIL
jgi:hypothetical protein